ncbi:MAG: dipeptidase, partial [Lachnospiraceae bacterium]|nr:dipeptidase [Lachnospiraceae bacterium]
MKVVDMHCDTISAILAERRKGKTAELKENDCHVDILKMQKGDYLLQNFALFVDMEACADPWEEVRALFTLYTQEMEANREWIAPVLTWNDIEKNRAEGRMSAMLTVEEGGVCGGSLAKLEELYGQGVRMLTLMWNYPNGLGHPNLNKHRRTAARLAAEEKSRTEAERLVLQYLNTPDTENGLTDTGAAFVQKMEELGMIIDVSHMSDAGFYQVLSLTKTPFVA